jgi:hypothetical protein
MTSHPAWLYNRQMHALFAEADQDQGGNGEIGTESAGDDIIVR